VKAVPHKALVTVSPFLASALYSINPFTCQQTHSDTKYHRQTTL